MFGSDDQNDTNTNQDNQSDNPVTNDNDNPVAEPVADTGTLVSPTVADDNSGQLDSPIGDDNNDLLGGASSTDDTSSTMDATDSSAPVVNDNDSTVANSDDLTGIKQDALKQLSPLVKQLDQSPEEKFRTMMMMIQASDDQSLIKEAFESAKQITDDKSRAQALLDIINEINYFTQQK